MKPARREARRDPSPSRLAILGLPFLLAVATGSRADLPAEGWPQSRRDAAQTGRSTEPALVDPVIAWTRVVGDSLGGEIVASGCSLYVANAGGEVLRVNARSGQREWRTAAPPACGAAGYADSSLALDTQGQVIAGLPGDPRLLELYQALWAIHVAIQSYSIDNNAWPPGIDLRSELTPTYIAPWPLNPCTGADVIVTDAESPGDIRYATPTPDVYYLGGWWVDGGLVPSPILTVDGLGGLEPSWPRSADPGGGGTAHEPADGAQRWRKTSRGIATSTNPRLLPGGIAWAEGALAAWNLATGAGRLHVTDTAGATRWESFRLNGYIGGTAVDEAAGTLFASAARAPFGWFLDREARTLASAAESYSMDNNVYPPTGELAPLVVPLYLPGMVPNALTGELATWSLAPSPGNYSYEALNAQTEYRVGMWNGDGELVSIVETGSLISPAPDEPATIECRALADGALLWKTPIDGTENPSPPLLTAEGVVVGDTGGIVRCLDRSDGHELWRVDAGISLSIAPALLPDGGLAFVQGGGFLLVIDPPPLQGVRWQLPLGALARSAPTVTSDGIILAGDWSGTLHAVRSDGSVLWTRDCGGAARSPLTTSVLPHEGWLYVGRADGAIVALAPASTGPLPPPLTGLLMAQRSATPEIAGLAWDGAPLPAAVLGVHYHLKRSLGSPTAPWENVLSPHDFSATRWDDASPGEPLVFYTLTVADCGENEPP